MPTQPSLQERLAPLSAAERQIVEDLVNNLEACEGPCTPMPISMNRSAMRSCCHEWAAAAGHQHFDLVAI